MKSIFSLDRTSIVQRVSLSVLVATIFSASSLLHAASGVWTNVNGGLWNTTGNWSGGTVASGKDFTADFGTLNLTADATVTLGTGKTTLGNLTFGDITAPTFNWVLNPTDATTVLELSDTNVQGNIIVNNGSRVTFNMVLADKQNDGFIKSGTGTLVLNAVNTYTGPTTVSGGVLRITNASALGATTGGAGNPGSTVNTGAALEIQGGITTLAEPLTLNGTGISTGGALRNTLNSNTFAGPITLASATRINSDSGTLTLTGGLTATNQNLTIGGAGDVSVSTVAIAAGTGTLTKDGAGTLTLGVANTFTGLTTVSGGTLAYGIANALSTGGVTVDGASSIFSVGAFSDSVGAVTLSNGASITGSTGVLTSTGSFAMQSGSVSAILAGAAIPLNKTTAGTVTLSKANTYTGATTVSGGKLTIASGGSINSTSGVSIGAGEFNYNSATALSQPLSFSTTGGKLSGTGTITPAVSVTSGNTLSPGNSIGTLSFGTGLTIAGTYEAELGTAGATPAAGVSDLAVVTGNLTLTGGTLILTDNAGANGQGSAGPGAYRLITFTGARTGTFSTVTNPLSSTLHQSVVYNGSSNGTVDLNYYRLASASAHTPAPVSLGNVRVGATATQALTLTNSATNDGFSEKLNASLGGATGSATTSGSFSLLAAGSTDSSSLLIGINTASAGSKTGTGTITLNSDGTGTSGFSTTALTSQTVNVSGSVYDFANVKYTGTTLAFGNVRSGASVSSQTVAFGNQTVTSASFQDLLNVSATTGNAKVTATGFTGLAASTSGVTTNNLSFGVSTTTAGSLASTASLTLVSNANGVAGLSNGTATVVGSPAAITTTGAVYDFANAKYTGATLAFGNVHVGASVSNQSVAIGNQTVTSASFQDLLDVSATTGNAKVTATGFTGLGASASGVTTNNLSFGVNTATVGSLASTASLTLTSNANSVAGLSNGTATVVGSPTSITTTGQVYSGAMIWNGSSGSFGTNANWNDSLDSNVHVAPGLDVGFAGVDSATFGNTAGAVTVSLNGSSPSLNALTFNNTGSYTLAQGSSGSVIFAGTTPSITSDGNHTISAPVNLGANTTVSVNSGKLVINGVVSESGGARSLTSNGAGTLSLASASTYSGGTTVSNGTLNVVNTSGSATGSGAFTLNPSGTLAGTGSIDAGANVISINGALVVGDSTLGSPVASLMTLTTSGAGSTVLDTSSSLFFDIFSNSGPLGDNTGIASSTDRLRLFGAVTVDPATQIVLGNPNSLSGWAVGDQWKLWDMTFATVSGSVSLTNISGITLGAGLGWNFSTGSGILSIVAVPEPSRALLLMMGLLSVAFRRRRK